MNTRRLIPVMGTMALASFLMPASVQGQARPAAAPAANKTWTMPRMADGHPDLQGVWTTSTLTPLERPAEFANKPFLTAEEAAAYEKRQAEDRKSTRLNSSHT